MCRTISTFSSDIARAVSRSHGAIGSSESSVTPRSPKLRRFAFGSPTPECMDSNSCDWWGDLFYDEWGPGFFLCLLLGAVIAWRVVPIRR